MRILLILVGVVLGAAALRTAGAVMGGLIGFLTAEVLLLRGRVTALEKRAVARPEPGAADEVIFVPEQAAAEQAAAPEERDTPTFETAKVAAAPPPPPTMGASSIGEAASGQSWPDRLFEKIGTFGAQGFEVVQQFLTGGNPVLKMGLIILFFGVAFLVKYAAQRNLVPLEFRLAAAALGGMILLALGWRLRSRAAAYGVGLQGGGVGILYLVVYGSAKLYHLLPVPLCFALMVALVVLSGVLAVLQDARALAVFGVVGGFLAPVLMSTGTGNHVTLFSYYGLLDAGILGIAWYKAWRELNLLGFFFTFGIATLWGSRAYQPAFFNTTEPFLILYFLFYLAISILFAHRQPPRLRGFIDGPLVFGLPLVTTGLQYALVKDMAYGMAVSSCAFGLFYLLLATLLWRRLAEGMRLLCEAFLALGVMFATMTIPLALDSQWTSAAWALEGAAMVWVGVRQNRLLARIFGILLQLGSAWTFVDDVFYPFDAIAFANRYFFGCIFIASAALFSSYYLNRSSEKLCRWEQFLALPLLIWGMLWWYFGGFRECDRHYERLETHDAMLLFGSASTMVMAMVARKSEWRQMAIAQAVQLPVMTLALAIGLFSMPGNSHLLAGWGLLAWGTAVYCQYRLLHLFDGTWPQWLAGWWHAATLWLLLMLASLEASWFMDVFLQLSEVWGMIGWAIIPGTALLLLIRLGKRLRWPVAAWERYYLGIAITVPAVLLALWSVFMLQEAGNPTPLRYVPLINPLELTLLFVILVLFAWAAACNRGSCRLPACIPGHVLYWMVAGMVFCWLNGAVARAVHFLGGIPYNPETLYHSMVFQAAVAALWSLGALSVTVWATRAGNRAVWCCGAVLLGLVVIKLFLVDLAGTGTVARIVSFLVVGILMLVIGYFSPMPPGKKEQSV